MRGWSVPWRGPVRAGLAACLIALLCAALIGSGRQPTREVLANAPVSADDPADPPTSPPVQLPDPSGRQVHQPASLSSAHPDADHGISGIPDVALAAYQRSAVVMGAANPTCHLDWALLAAIGQVESDNGQFAGSHLNANGVAHPKILGPRLDGRHGTSRITDTDAGRLDGDDRFDRAVGPMQFLPSTWAAVAVDGDDDGRRDVQDINDASLGSAVYLCADHDDLSTKAGQRRALLRYNHSQAYADRVLAIAQQLRGSSVLLGSDTPPPSTSDLSQVGFRSPGTNPGDQSGPDKPHATGAVVPQATASIEPTSPISGEPTSNPTDPGSTPTTGPSDPGTPSGPSDPSDPGSSDDPSDPGSSGDPSDPPTEAAVLSDPLPDELADLTAEQVDAYNAAWATCDDPLVDGWSDDGDIVDALTQCLADEIGVPTDDPTLVTFVDWLAHTEDGATE
jgi:hypothetical protein